MVVRGHQHPLFQQSDWAAYLHTNIKLVESCTKQWIQRIHPAAGPPWGELLDGLLYRQWSKTEMKSFYTHSHEINVWCCHGRKRYRKCFKLEWNQPNILISYYLLCLREIWNCPIKIWGYDRTHHECKLGWRIVLFWWFSGLSKGAFWGQAKH